MSTEIEIRRRGRVVERFDSDVDVRDVDGLASLLRRRARDLREQPGELELRARDGRHRRTVRV